MQIIPAGADKPLRSDLLVRAVLRSDLTPVPQTLELEVREAAETEPLKIGSTLRAGRQDAEFLIIKNTPGGDSGLTQQGEPMVTRKMLALLASCAPIAEPSARSVVRYGASLGEIYRAFGSQVKINQDFAVDAFACYKGATPSFEIAKALQEQGGALVMTDGNIGFRRLAEMLDGPPAGILREGSAPEVQSAFLERHIVPFVFSTNPAGEVISGRAEAGRAVLYRPRADAQILNNMSTVLVTRRKVNSDFAPHIMAGMRFDVAGTPYIVITAAHSLDGGADGDAGEQITRLWLGEVVKS